MKTHRSFASVLRRSRWILAGLLLASATLAAHDMWIEPTMFFPEVGRIVGLRLRVGQDLLGDPIPREADLINEFISVDSSGRKPVIGRDGADPAGLVRIATPGLLIAGYRSNPSPILLPAAKFNQYLKDEGLEAVADFRSKHNQTNTDAREVFARCAKSLVLSGPATDAQSDRPLGFTLELVALKNPYALDAGEELPLALTYEGRPLSGALVVAMNRKNPETKLSARTDKNGRVALRLAEGGMWLIKAVHMVPAAAGSNADWASYWASLTFELKREPTRVGER